jgi:uncharacterized protein
MQMVSRWLTLILSAALSVSASAALANPPSFDCSQAQSPDEVAICDDPGLSALDVLGTAGYDYVTRTYGRARAKQVARPFLMARHACGADAACIGGVQTQAVMAWRSLGAPLRLPSAAIPSDAPMPEVIGACAQTHISTIEGRLMGDQSFESGTAVEFSNGGHQVSYDREAAILSSRIGDPVSICLVHLPSNCPPGDDRGRVYQTTNQRNGANWTLPDAEHECGGA